MQFLLLNAAKNESYAILFAPSYVVPNPYIAYFFLRFLFIYFIIIIYIDPTMLSHVNIPDLHKLFLYRLQDRKETSRNVCFVSNLGRVHFVQP